MIKSLTPKEIVAELDKYIIGQDNAKKAVAIALRNRYRRALVPEEMQEEIIPKNILMIGPTGCGKTEIARRLAKLAKAPFIKVEATKFTEVGYVGRDVDSMVRDLVARSLALVEEEKIEEVKPQARKKAIDKIVDILEPSGIRQKAQDVGKSVNEGFQNVMGMLFPNQVGQTETTQPTVDEEQKARTERIQNRLREEILAGKRDDQDVEIQVEVQAQSPFQMFGGNGLEGMGIEIGGMFDSMMPTKKKKRVVPIKEAIEILTKQEAKNLIDKDNLQKEAVERAENQGIIFIDEMDKIAVKNGGHGDSVSREGVQRDILPIIEGTSVNTKYGSVSTNHILFIAAGAFHMSKPSDLTPELQGRLPIRVELVSLTKDDFKRILTEPKNALTKQYVELLKTEGVNVIFDESGIDEIAAIAEQTNSTMENIGARRLHTIMEKILEDVSYLAPDDISCDILVNKQYVQDKLGQIVSDDDLSKYIL